MKAQPPLYVVSRKNGAQVAICTSRADAESIANDRPCKITLSQSGKNPAAVALGRLGGLVKSEAKTRANSRNGRKGGAPKGNQNAKGNAALRQII